MSAKRDIAGMLELGLGLSGMVLLDTHGSKAYCICQSQPVPVAPSGRSGQWMAHRRGNSLSDCGIAVGSVSAARTVRADMGEAVVIDSFYLLSTKSEAGLREGSYGC
jgi:hypothetical protein